MVSHLGVLVTQACVYALLGLAVRILRDSGRLSVAHGAACGVLPYAIAVASDGHVLTGLATCLVWILMVGGAALLRAELFLLASLAVQVAWQEAVRALGDVTGGDHGIESPVAVIDSHLWSPLIGLALLVGACCILAILRRGPWGRRLISVGDSSDFALQVGVPVRMVRLQALFVSYGLAALAGLAMSTLLSRLDAQSFSLDLSMVALICGGLIPRYALAGPVAAAVTYVFFAEFLRAILDTSDPRLALLLLAGALVSISLVQERAWRTRKRGGVV